VRTPNIRPGADDFESASRAALAGGITTIGAFIGQNPDVPVAQTLAEADAASRTTIADAILHFTISEPAKLSVPEMNDRNFREIILGNYQAHL
jgi:dihydroorotase-like cyclic amidohydrolase